METGKNYIGYDYTEIKTSEQYLSLYLDGYTSFGWVADENHSQSANSIRLKRDRKIMNKAELTRLQRHFDACMEEIMALEKSKSSAATLASLVVGLVGTAFMAGSVFAVTATPPIIWLCALLAVPGIVGWAAPVFLHKMMYGQQAKKVQPLIDAKYDEIYEIGEKAAKLLSN